MANHSTINLFLLLGSEVLSALLSPNIPFIYCILSRQKTTVDSKLLFKSVNEF